MKTKIAPKPTAPKPKVKRYKAWHTQLEKAEMLKQFELYCQGKGKAPWEE